MSKTRSVTKICCCVELTDTLNTWPKRFIMTIVMLCFFEIFTHCQESMPTFSKHYSKCKTVSIKFRKILQVRRLPNFHRITHKTIFWTFWLLKIFLCLYNIPRISLKYFWNRHSWYVPQIFWKHCFVINGICQKINICYYQIIQF